MSNDQYLRIWVALDKSTGISKHGEKLPHQLATLLLLSLCISCIYSVWYCNFDPPYCMNAYRSILLIIFCLGIGAISGDPIMQRFAMTPLKDAAPPLITALPSSSTQHDPACAAQRTPNPQRFIHSSMVESSDGQGFFERAHASDSSGPSGTGTQPPVLPVANQYTRHDNNTSAKPPASPSVNYIESAVDQSTSHANIPRGHVTEKSSAPLPPPAPPLGRNEDGGSSSPIEAREKSSIAIRVYQICKDILLSSWLNVLLIFVPVGIALQVAKINPSVVFAMNAIAIVPLAGLLSHATQSIASDLGDTVGALMNVTFGNAVELIIL